MRTKPVLILFLLFIFAAAFFYFQSGKSVSGVKINKLGELNLLINPVFKKFGLTNASLRRKSIDDRYLGKTAYSSLFLEYSAGERFSWNSFVSDMKRALSNSRFTIIRVEEISSVGSDHFIMSVRYSKLEVLFLKIIRHKKFFESSGSQKVSEKGTSLKASSAAAGVIDGRKRYKNPKVAIVMDDFGHHINGLERFFNSNYPVTVAILPGKKHSRDIANLARSKGMEVILHLPLEPHKRDPSEETDTIRCVMKDHQILARLKKDIGDIPGAVGVNNHMGSRATEDRRVMTVILRYLKVNGLFFLDSLTSQKSVCADVAGSIGMSCLKRDIFLDNNNNAAAIEKQVGILSKMAFARGSVIAICHDRRNTIEVMSRMMPRMYSEGIRFVKLSDMVK